MDKKEEILKLLKKESELSISSISVEITLNYMWTKKYLKELEKEGKISSTEKGKYKYYKLKGGAK